MKTYKEQSREISKRCKSLIAKSAIFAETTKDSPYYEDLAYVLELLKEADEFLS